MKIVIQNSSFDGPSEAANLKTINDKSKGPLSQPGDSKNLKLNIPHIPAKRRLSVV